MKKRILTKQEEEFMKENWDKITREKLFKQLNFKSYISFYRIARELNLPIDRRMGRQGTSLKQWKPSLKLLLEKNKPFIAQDINREPKKVSLLKCHLRRNKHKYLFTVIRDRNYGALLVYTEQTRAKAWRLAKKKGLVLMPSGRVNWNRYGKSILNGNCVTNIGGGKIIRNKKYNDYVKKKEDRELTERFEGRLKKLKKELRK